LTEIDFGEYVVVGSGPAGVACARGLLARGLPVTMLDAGLELEPDKTDIVGRLGTVEPSLWPEDALRAVKAPLQADSSGVPLKFVFGSDFASRVPPPAPRLDFDGTRALRSYARGGLSNAWGATFLPFVQSDIADWPISIEDLAPHYSAVMRDVPLSAVADDLDEHFPFYTDRAKALRPSTQALSLLERLNAWRKQLRDKGFIFGQARLAVHAGETAGEKPGCIYCGLCLYGCPYGCIYCSTETLTALKKEPGFTYRPGILVRKVIEEGDAVRLECRDIAGGSAALFRAKRVFLAGGGISTPLILAESLGLKNSTLTVRCSQSFLVPLLTWRSAKGASREALNSLCQIFVTLQDPAVARRLVQLQIYTYNDLMPSVLRASIAGPLFRAFPFLEAAVLSRLVVMQGLLHSDDSDAMTIRMKDEGHYVLSGAVSDATRRTIRRIVRKVLSSYRQFGFAALPPLVKVSSPGQSYHSGGTFPMAKHPGPMESDIWGRPTGFRLVHAVDSTVLPSIPAPTFTFTVMANAHRIASHGW